MINKKSIMSMLVVLAMLFTSNYSLAVNSSTKITLTDDSITVNGEAMSKNSSDDIYLSKDMDNGGTSEEAKKANISVDNVINIKKSGTYEFSGTLTDGQITVDTNNINGDVVILLNNANITCKNAPAIFVYNKETDSSVCNVIIKTEKDSQNYISGGLIKQSVENWPDQEKIAYSIEKSYSDEGQYFERYKYDGAISSDISLTFEGEGTLTIESQREGIEVKRNITINSGNYIINSTEDGMNAAQDNESIITINGGTILVNTSKDGPQGDGIDSNGYLYINGGELYIFSNPTSQDSGLDSDLGIYINGGKIIATGNMYDEIKEDSKQDSVTLQFNKTIAANTLITLVDETNNPVMAFETDRDYMVMTFSVPGLEGKNYTAYEGGKVEGTKVNGLYTEITSYTLGTKVDSQVLTGSSRPFGGEMDFSDRNSVNIVLVVSMGVLFTLALVGAIVLIVMKKGNIISLLLGLLAGASITIMIVSLLNVGKPQMPRESGEFGGPQMSESNAQRPPEPRK